MRAAKPTKPYKDFPLTAHPNGTWCKKIKGKLHHFGGWADPDAALAKYLHQVHDLQVGREPSPLPADGQWTLIELCNEFLESKSKLVEIGELSRRQHFDYLKSCKHLVAILGENRIVEMLAPKDFDDLRLRLSLGVKSERVSKTTLGNRIRNARILFKYAYDQGFIPQPLKYGQNFGLPTKKALRAERNQKPEKWFSADELRKILDKAGQPLRTLVLLGINCGFGQTDCAKLTKSSIDLKKGWVTFPRPKTGIERRIPLWKETIKSLKEWLKVRPIPKDEQLEDRVFITKYGREFVRVGNTGAISDAVGGEFSKVLDELKLSANGRNFYSLRRTFETIGGDSRDQVAVDFIMGHAPESDDMAAVYRQAVFDDRLVAVTDYVHVWLWPKTRKRAPKRS
jgi:integrase